MPSLDNSPRNSPRNIDYDKTPKLPSFTGSESWKVWFNHFDDVACQRNWLEEKRLDVILPRLKGQAGEYVYDQFSCKQRSNYKELVDCLKKRFRKVESRKMFAYMFWKRDQKAGELEETYAAELKGLHGKVWPKHNLESTEEDLLQRFMNGLLDKKVKQQVEFMKNPTNVDNALDEVVKYWEACQVSSKDVGVSIVIDVPPAERGISYLWAFYNLVQINVWIEQDFTLYMNRSKE